MDHADPLKQLRELMPLRDLPAAERERLGVVREGRGRPRRIEPRPERDDYLERLAELRGQAVEVDPVLAAASDPRQAHKVLDRTIRELAVECASIGFDRVQAERRGEDVGSLCSRRVAGLAQIAALVGQRQRVEPVPLDVRSDKFQRVVEFFFETLTACVDATLQRDEATQFLARYRELLAGWEDRVDPPQR